MRMIDSATGRRQTWKEGSFREVHDIDLPCPEHIQDRRRHRSSRFSFPLPLLDRDDTRVSEIMKFCCCKSNARRRSGDLVSPHLQHVSRPFLPHRRSPFSFFPFFPFLLPFISRCKVHVSYAVKCMASAEYMLGLMSFLRNTHTTRVSIEPVETMLKNNSG